MNYKRLNQVKTAELIECMNKAFSDYLCPIQFTEETLQLFFKSSDIDKSVSFCAFSNNTMVGFILNSSNTYKGEQVVFDAGTGVIPEFRGQGVFTYFYEYVEQQLRNKNIKKYYLEVLQQNIKAKSIYERNGFSIVREFSVLQYSNISIKNNSSNVQLETLEKFEFSKLNNITLIEPSFENSFNVIIKNPQFYNIAYLLNNDRITAFCIYSINHGNLIQMGYDNILALKQVLIYITNNYKSVSAKNIDTSYNSVIEMMISIGFKQITSQFEMVKCIC